MMGTKRKLPFGYKMESGRVVIDSVEKSWVLHLFSRYNMGVSIRELTEFMNNTAVHTIRVNRGTRTWLPESWQIPDIWETADSRF